MTRIRDFQTAGSDLTDWATLPVDPTKGSMFESRLGTWFFFLIIFWWLEKQPIIKGKKSSQFYYETITTLTLQG